MIIDFMLIIKIELIAGILSSALMKLGMVLSFGQIQLIICASGARTNLGSWPLKVVLKPLVELFSHIRSVIVHSLR